MLSDRTAAPVLSEISIRHAWLLQFVTVCLLLLFLCIEASNQKRRAAALPGLPYYLKQDPTGFICECEVCELISVWGAHHSEIQFINSHRTES